MVTYENVINWLVLIGLAGGLAGVSVFAVARAAWRRAMARAPKAKRIAGRYSYLLG